MQISRVGADKDIKVRKHFRQITIIYNDLPRLVDLVLKKRSLEDCNFVLIKIRIDGGGSVLKFCMSIFGINNLLSKNKSGLSKNF